MARLSGLDTYRQKWSPIPVVIWLNVESYMQNRTSFPGLTLLMWPSLLPHRQTPTQRSLEFRTVRFHFVYHMRRIWFSDWFSETPWHIETPRVAVVEADRRSAEGLSAESFRPAKRGIANCRNYYLSLHIIWLIFGSSVFDLFCWRCVICCTFLQALVTIFLRKMLSWWTLEWVSEWVSWV